MRLALSSLGRHPPSFGPIPQRYPSLRWRKPVVIWTPIALALALGWPAYFVRDAPALMNTMLGAGAGALFIALGTTIVSFAFDRAPRTRRDIIVRTIWSGVAAAALTPLGYNVLVWAMRGASDPRPWIDVAALAATPLALLIGGPIALFAGLVFSFVAFVKPERMSWKQAAAGHSPQHHVLVTDAVVEAPQLPAPAPETPRTDVILHAKMVDDADADAD